MSVINCIKCSSRVDTDFDHDCKDDTCETCQREILEQEFVKAALALAEHTGAYAFSVPIKNTSPALFVELTEQSSFSLRQQLADMERKLEAALPTKAQDVGSPKAGNRMCSCIECIGYESEAGEDIERYAAPAPSPCTPEEAAELGMATIGWDRLVTSGLDNGKELAAIINADRQKRLVRDWMNNSFQGFPAGATKVTHWMPLPEAPKD